MLIDTHSHIYDEQFDGDREEIVKRASGVGIKYILLPAIDNESDEALFSTCREFPDICIPMMGLHPTSVNENPDYKKELVRVENYLKEPPRGIRFCAIGEIGLDLYWNQDYLIQQTEAFRFQIGLALEYDLPIVVHTRNAWEQTRNIIDSYRGAGLRGVMHSFSGSIEDYEYIKGCGDFLFGIGGPVTYKNSTTADVVKEIDIDDIILETDAPYLPPVPLRGKRNEPSYIIYVRDKIAEIKNLGAGKVEAATTANAERLFRF